ncbi:MAG: hypothetical protein CO096_14085 [Armatimonadetes bacterium CG_4_9_14_3_um_filter_66_14]|nr:MAG: hypothetical protein CO096_14085 [Armatimonadetes bacterium CG_4_9_14_3_um_filter_66_14]
MTVNLLMVRYVFVQRELAWVRGSRVCGVFRRDATETLPPSESTECRLLQQSTARAFFGPQAGRQTLSFGEII